MTMNRQPSPVPAEPNPDDVQFGYFLLHTHQAAGKERTLVRLTLEDLSSGDKSTFESTRELLRFLDAWLHGPSDERFAPRGADVGGTSASEGAAP